MVTCWGTMTVHHEIPRSIRITFTLQHMIFDGWVSLGWLKRLSMSCLYAYRHTCKTVEGEPRWPLLYFKRHCSLFIKSFLAHVPTLRCSWRMYQQSTSRQVDCYSQKTGTHQHAYKVIGMIFVHLIAYANNALSIYWSSHMYQQLRMRQKVPIPLKSLDRSTRQ